MPIGAPKSISTCKRLFLEPRSPKQRQYEAFRAYFVEERPSKDVDLLRRLGVDPVVARSIVGHADAEMTEHYSQVSGEEQAAAVGKVVAFLGVR